MRNAFLILAHKNVQQLKKLISFLSTNKEDKIFIHIDKREDAIFNDITSEFKSQANVIVIEKRYPVYWGSYNQIKATLSLINSAAAENFDYVHLISGQDLPLMPVSEMNRFLTENAGKQFIECVPLPNKSWNRDGGLERMSFFWFDGKFARFTYRTHLLQKQFKFRRRMPALPLYGGTNWFSLTGDFVIWIAQYIRENSSYLRRYRFTRNADEIFVQTLLMASPFAKSHHNDHLRYINWSDGPEYPRTLRKEDLEKIFMVKNCLFARKFDETVDAKIIDLVYSKLNEQIPST